MLFKIKNGSVSFGADTVLENIDFEIQGREKVAIVGRNGAGKSTLLKCITGEVDVEEGTGEDAFAITKVGVNQVGYLKQIEFTDENATLIEEVLKVFEPILETERKMQTLVQKMQCVSDEKLIKEYSALAERFEFLGGYTYQKEYSVMIKKFGFSDSDRLKRLKEFSGGQRTKIAFIKLLLSHPDILLLDEPTNHLDVAAVKWLENYIKNYKSAVVMVSHDRMFVEKAVDKVYEIEYGETRCYKGNYSEFERQKKENYQKQLKDHEYQRQEIDRLMRLVERFRYKATKAKMVQSKLKQIERMKIVDKPDRYDLKAFHANFQPQTESVKKVFFAKQLEIGYDKPLANISLELLRGQKLGVIGDNGVGKSTFLKTIIKEIGALGGSFEFGVKTEVGYFSQQMAQYSSDMTVFEDFHQSFPMLNETQVRSALGAFLFSGEDVFKCVSDLSGGERVRLALCKLFKKRPNFLILDEPTNHMDIVGKETLENMLVEFSGTVIFVSHDRYFVNKVADRILSIEKDGAVFYPHGYKEYEVIEREKLEREEQKLREEKRQSCGQTGAKKSFSTPLKDKNRKQKRIDKLEQLTSECEKVIKQLNSQLENPEVYCDYEKVLEIQNQLNERVKEQDAYEKEWLTLCEELENL